MHERSPVRIQTETTTDKPGFASAHLRGSIFHSWIAWLKLVLVGVLFKRRGRDTICCRERMAFRRAGKDRKLQGPAQARHVADITQSP